MLQAGVQQRQRVAVVPAKHRHCSCGGVTDGGLKIVEAADCERPRGRRGCFQRRHRLEGGETHGSGGIFKGMDECGKEAAGPSSLCAETEDGGHAGAPVLMLQQPGDGVQRLFANAAEPSQTGQRRQADIAVPRGDQLQQQLFVLGLHALSESGERRRLLPSGESSRPISGIEAASARMRPE